METDSAFREFLMPICPAASDTIQLTQAQLRHSIEADFMTLLKDCPRRKLLFFVAQDFDESLADEVRKFVETMECMKDWVIGPPEFIDETTEMEVGSPIRTLGVMFEIYSSITPFRLPKNVDLRHFEEVEALVERVCEFSRKHGLEIELELDRELVGTIEDGQPDRFLREGLIDEWRRQLALQ